MDGSQVVPVLESGGEIEVDLDGEIFKAGKDKLDIRIESKEGFTVSMENNVFVILDTTLNEELINEGFAREMISRIQQMRKNNGYEMMDNIKIFYNADEEFIKGIDTFEEYLKGETLAKSLEISDDKEFEEYVLNDHNVKIFIERI